MMSLGLLPRNALRTGVELLLLICLVASCAQAIDISWQKCLGGSEDEEAYSVQQTSDGGYVVAGYTWSNDGDVGGNHGSADFWVVRLNASRGIEWQRWLGGLREDKAYNIQQTFDGGCVVAGYTASNDSDVSRKHGLIDYWVVKLNEAGNMVWQRCLGGAQNDNANSIQQTADGGYVVAGYTYSNDGDVSGKHGVSDYWVVKIDLDGDLVWQRCLGGAQNDNAKSVQQTADGGYVVAGYTWSNDGNVSENHGQADFWVVKLNESGNMVWQRCLGGSGADGATSIQQTADGGYVVAGDTESNNGDVSGHHGGRDCWVVKLNKSGNMVWQRCLGGAGYDQAESVRQTSDGGYVVAGYTESNNGDVSGKHGRSDYWVVKLNEAGNMVWQRCLGGSDGDRAYRVQPTSDDGYLVAGGTASSNLDVSGNHGKLDFWIVKLGGINCTWTSSSPVCKGTPVQFTGPAGMDSYSWEFGDGQASSSKDPSHLYAAPGSYVVNLTVTTGSCSSSCNGTAEVDPLTCSQPPAYIEWQRCFGGYNLEEAFSIQQTSDGGYVVAGYTESDDGNVSGNHGGWGNQDFWVVKLDPAGNLVWQKCLGGFADDKAYSIQQTSDSGYVVAGHTWSNDGDVTGNHGHFDYWVVKLNESGNMVWQKCLGGSAGDAASSVQQTSDGGYVVAGYTESDDGNVSGNHGGSDFWVVKLDPDGDLVWQKCLGGGGQDWASSIQQTSDGGYVVAGGTSSGDGDVTENHGYFDFWVVKLNSSGNIDWQKCVTERYFNAASSIQQTSDGGYVVAGQTWVPSGNVSGHHGFFDCTVVKLNSSGNIDWLKYLGGSSWDEASSIQQTSDGGYVVVGSTDSHDGDVSGNHGGWGDQDFWVVKLDPSGNIEWQKCLGGSEWDDGNSIRQTADGEYVIAGGTSSGDGDVSGNHGGSDWWVVKLAEINSTITAPDVAGAGSAHNVAATAESGADYSWTITNGAITSASNAQSIEFNAGASGITRLNVTVFKNCLCRKSYKDITTLDLLPDCSWSSNAPICGGTPVQFSGPAGMEVYHWEFGDGQVGSEKDPAHMYSAPGTYTVNLTVTRPGCSKSCTGSVVVKPMPDCSWTYSSPVCDGTEVKFTGPTGMDSYSWDLGDGAASLEKDPAHLYSAPGTYAVNLTVTKDGCSKSCTGSVLVKQTPDISWTSSSPSCNGTPVNFTCPAEMDSYGWDFGDGQTSSGRSPTHLYRSPGTYAVSLTAGKDGCTESFTRDITVAAEPDCSITAPGSVCAGSAGNIASTATPGAAYAWSITNGQITSASNTQSIAFTPGASGTTRLEVRVTADGCAKTCTKTVEIRAQDCSWTSNSPVWSGTPVKFTGPAGMDIYRWEFGDGAVSSVKDPAHLYSAPGTYTVNLKATNGGCSKSCTGSVVVTSDTGECWTDNSPVCNGTAVVFDAIAGMDSYKWRFGDGQSSSLEDTSHLYSAPGEYPVGLTMRIGNLYKTCGRSVAVKSCPTHLTVTTPITPMSDGSPIRFDSPSGKETYQEELGDGQAGSQENRIRIYPG